MSPRTNLNNSRKFLVIGLGVALTNQSFFKNQNVLNIELVAQGVPKFIKKKDT